MERGRTCSRGHTFLGEEPCPACWPGYRTYEMKAELWLYPGESANWHFLTLPSVDAAKIRDRFGGSSRGWGSLRVTVRIGNTRWETSIFPDKKSGSYLLPVKSDVRKREGISAGDTVPFTLEIHG